MQIPDHPTDKLLEGLAPMISGHVGMHLAPEPFDVVVLGAVGWQEVQTEETSLLPQVFFHSPAGVDSVVIQDQMNAPSPRMMLPELFQQSEEQIAVLPIRGHEHQIVASHRPGAGEIALAVLSRREDELLSTREHPVPTDSRVEVDVDLIFEIGDFAGGESVDYLSDRPQSTGFAGLRPGTDDDGTRHAPPSPQILQHPSHGGHADLHSGLSVQGSREEFPGPVGTGPAMILRRTVDQLRQRLTNIVIHFQLSVLPPAIEQPFFPERLEPTDHPHGRCGNTSQRRCDAVRSPAGLVKKDDLDPRPQPSVLGFPHRTFQSPLHCAWQSHYNTLVHVGLPDGAARHSARKIRRPFYLVPTRKTIL